jgi:outer membrane protein TolC
MRHTAILLISIALYANEARGQQWTLDACVDAALHNNVELKNSRLESEMAAEDKAQAFTNYFPQLSATGAGFIGAKDLMRGEMEVPMMGAMPLSMVKKGVLATLTALQPLYTGGQVIVGNKLAALQQEVRALQLEMTAKDVQQNVATYFWRLVALRSNITTLDAVDSQLQEVYRQTEQYLQAGVINRNELLRVQLKREEISS